MFEVGQQMFRGISKYILVYERYVNTTYMIAEILDISYQKLNAITRKNNGRFTKHKIDNESHITFFKIEDVQNCAEELNAMLLAKELTK